MSETLALFRRAQRRDRNLVPREELARRDQAIAALRDRLEYMQQALDVSTRERTALEGVVRDLTAFREETEGLSAVLLEALREHRQAMSALESALG